MPYVHVSESVTVCHLIALHRAVVLETSGNLCHSIALHRTAVQETSIQPPISVDVGMFVPVLGMQCSPSQRDKWFNRAERYEILGTYAQTELGHGNDDVQDMFYRFLVCLQPVCKWLIVANLQINACNPRASGIQSTVCIVHHIAYTCHTDAYSV